MQLVRRGAILALPALFVALLLGARGVLSAAPSDPVKAKARQAVAKGLDYLRHVQEPDGSWSNYPGTTALALAGFLRNGRTELNEPAVAKGIKYILSAAHPNGAIYSDANPANSLPNYNTALCLAALALTHNPAYKSTLQKAQDYLEHSQLDDGSGISVSNPAYGGIGYGNHPDRPDLSNLQTALDGLKDSGLSPSAPCWKKAIIFLQRVQNRKESNDQAWAKDADNDGGFIYTSQGRSFNMVNGKPASYGSMTYAGLKSYIYCGVSRDDPRAQAAWNWIRGHYSVTDNPGMGDTALYYYYHTMAKTLDVYGQKIVRDSSGKPHDWANDLAAQLVAMQKPDGSWYNNNSRYWEDQPALVTSFTLMALSYCLKH